MQKYPEWLKITEVIVFFVIIPTIIFYFIALRHPSFLRYSYYFLVSMALLQAFMSYWYDFGAIKRRPYEHNLSYNYSKPVPRTSFLISAYLPNETDVIEDTILNILNNVERPAEGIEVILDYNTPRSTGIEARLRKLSYQHPELILANAYYSRSKSENLNYALDIASGDIIALIDADHLVAPDCLKRAWRWLDGGYDVVQGRCKIRNGDSNGLTALIEVEFESIYGIAHFSKTALFQTGLFGGANGYWKKDILKNIRFRTNVLTEDIDATLRALLSGYHIFHDRTIISTEVAPDNLRQLWYQRKRWAQGWFQCTLMHQAEVLKSKYFNMRQRFVWITLLFWRVFYDLVIHFIYPVLITYWIYIGRIEIPLDWFIVTSLIITFFQAPVEGIVAFKNAVPPKYASRYVYYGLFGFPYHLFKNTIQIVAIRDELFGQKEWVVTTRK